MASKKAALHTYTPGPGIYRDDPDRDDAASTSSAVLLGDIDSFPDEDLPAYEDNPSESQSSFVPNVSAPAPNLNGTFDPRNNWYCPPPDLPFQSNSLGKKEIRTRFPNYSTHTQTLYNMIKQQASYPPTYFVEIHGTHTETSRQGNKETKNKVVDFVVNLNVTHLVTPGRGIGGKIELLPHNKRGYRGTRFPSLNPTVSDVESQDDELMAWCEKYVADTSKIKTFTLKRKIINHDTKRLEQLLRSAISETNYRGHVSIRFPTSHDSVIVFSPGIINQWRVTTWIRWVFYISCLWILTWPFLFFLTSRYDVVKVVYQYADKPPGNDMERNPTVMNEVDWFHRWGSAIKRAALARMRCEDGALTEEYRIATARADERGEQLARNPVPQPSTGNAFADGAIGLLGHGLRVAESFNNARGWGGDC